ncbi:hypothetical protein [Sorangium sp. So ce117]|uniref:hypothetical protein n=1 Tax=Sorangium sp. So ce117 TaxID=3133277 RepID=UPI003F62CB91
MTAPADFMKRRSVGIWSFLLVAAPLGLGGCVLADDEDARRDEPPVHNGDEDEGDSRVPPPRAPAGDPRLVAIDTGAVLSSPPGEGIGIFLEYAPGGTWKLWTTCDTNTSKVICSFDLYVSVDTSSQLFDIAGIELETKDSTRLVSDGVAHLHAETGSDIDAMEFTTTQGAIIRLEAYVDGVLQPRFVYWFGNGVLHQGAPSNPLDFKPTAP